MKVQQPGRSLDREFVYSFRHSMRLQIPGDLLADTETLGTATGLIPTSG